jgi:hypothetical protein
MKKLFSQRFVIRMYLLKIFILISIPSYSVKYYVDISGNNSNNGSSTSPWLSLNYACSKATTPGDIIHINAGSFNETNKLNLAVGVSIEGAGTDATIINSKYVASSSSDGAILLNSSTFTSGTQSISNLTLTGSNLTATRAICINYRNNVTIHHCKIVDFYASGVFFRGSNQAWDVEPNPYASGNSLYNCTVNNCGTRSTGESASIRINGQNGFLLHDNTFTQTFRASGQNGNILGGEWNQGLKIYANTFTKSDNEGSAWNFFFELWHWQGGGEVHGNTFKGAATMDIVDVMKSTAEYGLKIYDNDYLVASTIAFTAHQPYSITVEGRSRLEYMYIYDNYFKNVPNAIEYNMTVNTGEGYSSFNVNHIYLYGNVLENVGMTDLSNYPIWIEGYGSNSNITVDNFSIYNNSIQGVNNSNKALTGIQWDVAGKFSNLFIQNNIITNCRNAAITFHSNLSGATLSNVTVNNNLYYNNATNAAAYNMTVSNKVENNNIVGNPLFVSLTDYHLQGSSPAINKGINVGLPYNGSAPDIGAFETGNTSDATAPIVTAFSISSTTSSLTVPITGFTATDNIGVTGYLVNESSIAPLISSSRWSSTSPTTYLALTEGTKTLFAWVKDAAGNVSASMSRNVSITLPVIGTSNVYYLSPSGNDLSGNGTLDSPWFTLNKAWTVVKPGDIVYMRGGTYLYASSQSLRNKSGVAGSLIKVWAMPGELPVIAPAAGYTGTRGIDIYGNYIHIKGLEIKGFTQRTSSALYYGLWAENCNFNIYELLKVHDNGFGLSLGNDSGDNLVLNSDFYRNSDPLSSFGSNVAWRGANGIAIKSSNVSKTNTIRGCRIWWNSNNGVDLLETQGTVVIENCWSFWNGYIPGTFTTGGYGDGFRLGNTLTDMSSLVKRILKNNLSFENRKGGFNQNNAMCITVLYNNTSYQNGSRSFDFWNGTAATIAKNNLDFNSYAALFNSQAILNHNNFLMDGNANPDYNVTSSDFVSIDHTGVDGPRQVNGSLPDLNFLHLAQGSDLINRGINVGLSYYGAAPDLGAFETRYLDTTSPIITVFTIPSTSSSLTIPITSIIATDNIGVTGYVLTESSTIPTTGVGWTSSFPSSFNFTSEGTKTLYAWAKDAAGNVSTSVSRSVTISLIKSAEIPMASEEKMTAATHDTLLIEAKASTAATHDPFKIDVFPNPCKDNVTVRFSQMPDAGSRIEIIDITGRKVASREITNTNERFILTEPAGLYMVKTTVGSTEVTNKLIISK